MGAAASRPPSAPSSCSKVETESRTRIFTVTDYSRWARMPPGTALNLHFQSYNLKVYPAGLDGDSADFMAVFVDGALDDDYYSPYGPARFYLEILDASRKHTVFDNHTARSEQTLRGHKRGKGYVRFVNRQEMEASCCVSEEDDSLTIRCTLLVDRTVTWPLLLAALPPRPWTAARRRSDPAQSPSKASRGFGLPSELGSAPTRPTSPSAAAAGISSCTPMGTAMAARTTCPSSLAAGSPTSRRPRQSSASSSLTMASRRRRRPARRRSSRSTRSTVTPLCTRPRTCMVTSSDLAAAGDDCLVVRCHLRVIKVTTPSLRLPAAAAPTVTAPPCEVSDGIEKTPTSPPGAIVVETEEEQTSESDQTPLLANLHQR